MMTSLPWIIAGAGAWSLINGILHDVFVLTSDHGRQYDRNLLRLLMDGHILITCGIVLMVAGWGTASGNVIFYYVALAATASLLGYCAMIFPFLKSIGTIAVNLFTMVLIILRLFTFK